MGLSRTQILKGIETYTPPPNRRGIIRNYGKKKLTIINDSKGSNPKSLEIVLKSLDHDVILIIGGRCKNIFYDGLHELLGQKVKSLILLDEGKDKFKKLPFLGSIHTASSMEECAVQINQAAAPGDTILFHGLLESKAEELLKLR